jgi:hypothetical protein
MDEKKFVALISLLGIVISVTASLLIGRMNNVAQFERFTKEIEQKYTQPLFQKRIEVYPELYSIISGFAKKSNIGIATNVDIKKTVQLVDSWNNKNAIFASNSLIGKLSNFRHELHEWSSLTNKQLQTTEIQKKIFYKIRDIEKSLQQEIGIFATQGFHNHYWFNKDSK